MKEDVLKNIHQGVAQGRPQDRRLPVNHTDQLEKNQHAAQRHNRCRENRKKKQNKWVKIVRKYLMDGWMGGCVAK